jgi:AcrR family transcriptional regulator
MARWEPNARLRLVRAALELCTDQGYEATTIAEIAARAGLTKTTFFRHFPDKREVLFAGQDEHSRILAEAIAAAPAEAAPIEAVAAAVVSLAERFTDENRAFGRMLIALIAANDDLKERAAYKHASLVQATAGALEARNVPPAPAWLAAEVGVRAFHEAFAQWIEPGAEDSLTTLTNASLDRLRTAANMLGASRAG